MMATKGMKPSLVFWGVKEKGDIKKNILNIGNMNP